MRRPLPNHQRPYPMRHRHLLEGISCAVPVHFIPGIRLLLLKQQTSAPMKTRIATMTLTAARERLRAIIEQTEYGPGRIALSQARSELGLMIDELELKREATDTTIDLMITFSLTEP